MKTKRIEYSYQSSPNAVRFGYKKAGCYTVYLGETPHAGFDSFEEASDYADTIDLPWNTKTHQPHKRAHILLEWREAELKQALKWHDLNNRGVWEYDKNRAEAFTAGFQQGWQALANLMSLHGQFTENFGL